MNQKPTAEVSNFLLKRKTFSLSDVVKTTGLDRRKVLRVLEKFRNEGFLQIVNEKKVRSGKGESGPFRRNPCYKRIKDISERPRRKQPFCGRDRIWRTIRILRKFKRSDLVRLTGIKEATIQVYICQLVNCGYLKNLGRDEREKVFFLIKDAGPKRPENTKNAEAHNEEIKT